VMDDRRLRQTVNFRKRCTRIESRTSARYVYIVQGRRRRGRGTECSHIIIISETLEMSVTIMIAPVSFFVRRKNLFFIAETSIFLCLFVFWSLLFFSVFGYFYLYLSSLCVFNV